MNQAMVYFPDGRSTTAPLSESSGAWRLAEIPAGAERVDFQFDDFAVAAGREGYFVISSAKSSSTPGALVMFKNRPDTEHEFDESFAMPMFGVKNGENAVLAVVTRGSFDFTLGVAVRSNAYTLTVRFKLADEAPEVRLFPLSGAEADYCGIARRYRRYQLERGACRTLRDRCAGNPVLAEVAQSIGVRIRMAWKPMPPTVLEQTPENEPAPQVAVTFARARQILAACRDAGIRHAEFCLVGWNRGGHDGRFPDLFPVEPALGGEAELRELLKFARDCGYLMSAHTNLVDSYSISARCTPDDRLRDRDGSDHLGGQWGGGQSYYLCPRRAYEKFAREDFTALKELGFHGMHYLDVATIKPPNPCFHPDHPLSAREAAAWRGKTQQLAREYFGASASEGSFDFCIGDFDYALYANFAAAFNAPPICDRLIPLWSIVYHGIVMCNCAYPTINEMVKDDPDLNLYNLEYGGRPQAYFHSKFRPDSDKPEQDLRCSTDAELAFGVERLARRAKQYAAFAPLQFEFMEHHDEVRPGVFEIGYSDGSRLTINRSGTPHGAVAPHSFALVR